MSQPQETDDRCESPPVPTRCSSTHCAFYANPECSGMCSICFKAFLSKQKAPQAEKIETMKPTPSSPLAIPMQPDPSTHENGNETVVTASPAKRPRPIRCATCQKRLGLMGFPCRCGGQYCEQHRYPDKHDCAFDRKAAEKVKLKEENPVILGDKIERV